MNLPPPPAADAPLQPDCAAAAADGDGGAHDGPLRRVRRRGTLRRGTPGKGG